MTSTVIQVSKQELAQIISNTIEQKLIELFGDPDESLTMKANVRTRLLRQKKGVTKGDRGVDLGSIRKKLGI